MLNTLVHDKPVSMGSQSALFNPTHVDMLDSIGPMKDKKVASKEKFLSILFTWEYRMKI
jgi:hypothetical protein